MRNSLKEKMARNIRHLKNLIEKVSEEKEKELRDYMATIDPNSLEWKYLDTMIHSNNIHLPGQVQLDRSHPEVDWRRFDHSELEKKWKAADIEDLTVAVKRKKAKQSGKIFPTQEEALEAFLKNENPKKLEYKFLDAYSKFEGDDSDFNNHFARVWKLYPSLQHNAAARKKFNDDTLYMDNWVLEYLKAAGYKVDEVLKPKTIKKKSEKLTLENFFIWKREKTDFEIEHEEEISNVYCIIDNAVSDAKEYGQFSKEKSGKAEMVKECISELKYESMTKDFLWDFDRWLSQNKIKLEDWIEYYIYH